MVGAGKPATMLISRWPICANRKASAPRSSAISCKSAPAEKKWVLPVITIRAGQRPASSSRALVNASTRARVMRLVPSSDSSRSTVISPRISTAQSFSADCAEWFNTVQSSKTVRFALCLGGEDSGAPPEADSASRRHTSWLHVATDEFDDAIHGSPRLKHRRNSCVFEGFHVLVGNDAAHQQQHVIHLVLPEQVHHARHDGVVRPRQNAEADDVHVFLQRGVDNHLGSLPQAGVDHFHAGIAQRA